MQKMYLATRQEIIDAKVLSNLKAKLEFMLASDNTGVVAELLDVIRFNRFVMGNRFDMANNGDTYGCQ